MQISKLICSIIVFCFFSTCLANCVWAKDVGIAWNQSTKATGYKIELSVDEGASWVKVPDFTATLYTEGTRLKAKTTITIPDNVLVLARVGAFNAQGVSWRLQDGAWFNTAWEPISPPTGLGAN